MTLWGHLVMGWHHFLWNMACECDFRNCPCHAMVSGNP